jgi:hypothetical protein
MEVDFDKDSGEIRIAGKPKGSKKKKEEKKED